MVKTHDIVHNLKYVKGNVHRVVTLNY